MPNLPKLTETQIRQWTDSGSFERGRGYYNEGRILHPRRQGTELKGECLGSMPSPYRVQVTLTPQGIGGGHCSCPVGYRCKHSVALLLTWLHEPETFAELEEQQNALASRSKEELIALIERMLARAPELEDLLELQTLSQVPPSQAIDPERIREQVRRATYSGGDEWGHSYNDWQALNDVVDIGADYEAREDWRNARIVYSTAAQAILDNYENVYDDEGEMLMPVDDCVAGLQRCMEAAGDDDEREEILHALYSIYSWNIDVGGYGVGDAAWVTLVEDTTAEEKQKIARWVRGKIAGLKRDDSYSKEWRLRSYGSLLLSLQEEEMDDESYLQLCRETARTNDLVRRLLELQRVEEAVTVTKEMGDYELLRLADVFLAQGHDTLAREIVQERAETSQDRRFKPWLKNYAESHNEPEVALALAEELFWQNPSLRSYEELRPLAEPLDRWSTLRAKVLKKLARETRHHGLLIQIHLSEGDVRQAIDTLKKTAPRSASADSQPWGRYHAASRMIIPVAQAAEDDYPGEAIALYMQSAHRLIAARGRDNYAIAAQHLLRVRELYGRMGKGGDFQRLLHDLREQNPRLRALKDELQKAGL